MNIDKPTLLKICEWLGGVPNWTDKNDPEMNEIKTWLITKQARGMIQDRLLEDSDIMTLKSYPSRHNGQYRVTLCYVDEEYKRKAGYLEHSFDNGCHNMAWLLAAAWWVNER